VWNFEKFLVGPDGTVLARFRPQVTPEDPALIACHRGESPRLSRAGRHGSVSALWGQRSEPMIGFGLRRARPACA
jgi:hypothetical protein